VQRDDDRRLQLIGGVASHLLPASEAQRDTSSRQNVGKVVLVP
jgi:hypothetical protein